MYNKELLIFYLTANDRNFIFEKFIKELSNVGKLNSIKLLISSSTNDISYYNNYLSNFDIDYHIEVVPCPSHDYIPKVKHAIKYAKDNNIPYIMKCDNDVILPTYTFDFILEDLKKLDDVDNLTISPTITTGIPSVEYFIEDFLSLDENVLVKKEFNKCEFFKQPGIMDYRFLNNISDTWSGEIFFKTLKDEIDKMEDTGNGRTPDGYCKFYKGIHPIRHGFGNEIINNYIIKNRDDFFKIKSCYLFVDKNPYLCDMCFFINTNNYDILINNEDLLIDGCDEVPLNRYRDNKSLNNLIVRGGYAIHITYNWRWHLNEKDGGSNITKPEISLVEFEKKFISQL
jgi:hypothetical protein